LETFWIGSDCHVYHRWSGGSGSLGGCAIASNGFDVGRNKDGRLEIFVRGTDGGIWHDWQTRAGSGPWSGWSELSGRNYVTTGPTVISMYSSEPNMQVDARVNGVPWYDVQLVPGGGWSGWIKG
jgi:hypothetical protein